MPATRKSLSIATLLLAALALGGCYDLSDPSGPQRDDFVRHPSTTEQQEQGATQVENQVRCEPAPCSSADDLKIQALQTMDADRESADDKIRIVPVER